jgi:hypothetical protein
MGCETRAKSMAGSLVKVRGAGFITTVVAGICVLVSPAQTQGSGPFSSLAGNWAGGGSLAIGNSANESIRCRAQYRVGSGGATASLELRCASDSYKFELQSNVRYQNGEVLGDWSEKTRGAAGRVVGSIKGDQVNVRVEGQTFSALLSLTTRGDKQSISITGPVGREMSEASITLNRRG